jgi:Type IV secretion system pilin
MFIFTFFPVAHAGSITNAPSVTTLLVNVLQFLLSIAGVVGIIGMLVAGFLYLGASGDERQLRKAKTVATVSVIGIVVILAALVIVTQAGSLFS